MNYRSDILREFSSIPLQILSDILSPVNYARLALYYMYLYIIIYVPIHIAYTTYKWSSFFIRLKAEASR